MDDSSKACIPKFLLPYCPMQAPMGARSSNAKIQFHGGSA